MNILYYSVHQVLEDDEVRCFQRLGHNVVCLGTSGIYGAAQNFRAPIQFSSTEIGLYKAFEAMGGRYKFGDKIEDINIPHEFMRLIDVTIVMYVTEFISHFWKVLHAKPVVWRTIAQGIDIFDDVLRPFRKAGLRIVRKSPMERPANTIGQDAIIRFGKSPEFYNGWAGDKSQIVTFTHTYKQRYEHDLADYQMIVKDLPALLGGAGNETVPNSIGAVSAEEQCQLLRSSQVYLYASAINVPYTLNFIEAWMTGIPVVVHSPLDRQGPYFEIDRLMTDNVNGFICRTVEETRARLAHLLRDEKERVRIGQAGRHSAISIFGEARNQSEWASFLAKVKNFAPAVPVDEAQKAKLVGNTFKRLVGSFGARKIKE